MPTYIRLHTFCIDASSQYMYMRFTLVKHFTKLAPPPDSQSDQLIEIRCQNYYNDSHSKSRSETNHHYFCKNLLWLRTAILNSILCRQEIVSQPYNLGRNKRPRRWKRWNWPSGWRHIPSPDPRQWFTLTIFRPCLTPWRIRSTRRIFRSLNTLWTLMDRWGMGQHLLQ